MRKAPLVSISAFALLFAGLALAQLPEPGGGTGGGGGGSTEGNAYTASGGTAAAPTLTCPASKLTNGFSHTLSANATFGAPSSCPTGMLVLEITQNGTGGYTCAFNAVFTDLPSVPCDSVASHRTRLMFYNNGTTLALVTSAWPDSDLQTMTWQDGTTTYFNTGCADAGSNDTYACNMPPTTAAYVTGQHYWLKANTANTGAATVNFSSLGAKTIKKAAGGITTDLSDNDIRAGQWVDLVYDGTNMQMQSLLGNSAAGATTKTYIHRVPLDGNGTTAGTIAASVYGQKGIQFTFPSDAASTRTVYFYLPMMPFRTGNITWTADITTTVNNDGSDVVQFDTSVMCIIPGTTNPNPAGWTLSTPVVVSGTFNYNIWKQLTGTLVSADLCSGSQRTVVKFVRTDNVATEDEYAYLLSIEFTITETL